MNVPRSWFSLRLSLRLGHRRWLLRFPPRLRRWQILVAAVVLLPLGYVVGAVPTCEMLERTGLADYPLVEFLIETFYAPLIWLDEQIAFFRWFFEWEHDLIERMGGT